MLENENPNDYDNAVSLDEDSQVKAAKVAEEIYDEEQRRAFSKMLAQEEFVAFLKWLFIRTGYMQQVNKASGEMNIRLGEENIGKSVAELLFEYAPGSLERVLSYRLKANPRLTQQPEIRNGK